MNIGRNNDIEPISTQCRYDFDMISMRDCFIDASCDHLGSSLAYLFLGLPPHPSFGSDCSSILRVGHGAVYDAHEGRVGWP